jgi:hypothetical protein
MGGSLGKQNPSAVACASATRCVEVGQDVFTTVNGGKSWQQGQAPTMLGFGLSLACPTTVWCMAVGKGPEAHAYTTSNGGRDWGEVASPGPQSFGDIGCTRGGACELMGGPNH